MAASARTCAGGVQAAGYSFFFYGTLCHPPILSRVLNRSCHELVFQDAILPGYTRHHVKGEDYPALIDNTQAAHLSKIAYQDKRDHERPDGGSAQAQGSVGSGQTSRDTEWEMINDDVDVKSTRRSSQTSGCRGTMVHGLTYNDVLALDIFEGTEYTRRQVTVVPLSSNRSNSSSSTPHDHLAELESSDRTKEHNKQGETAAEEVWVYLWSDPLEKLDPEEWDFATFVRDKASIWTGTATTEYADVEHHHAASASNGLDVQIAPQSESTDVDKGSGHNADPEGHDADMQKATEVLHEHLVAAETEQREKEPGDASTRRFQSEEATSDTTDVSIDGAKVDGYPDFGHNMRQYWPFNPNTINLNNGSYGASPLPIMQRRREILEQCERDPNRFIKRTYLPMLTESRKAVAGLIGAEGNVDEVVLVPNASSGVQGVLREIEWEEGDVIMVYNTTYGAIAQSVKYLCDRHPAISMRVIQLDMPVTHQSIIDTTAAALKELNQLAIPNYTGRPKARGIDVGERVRMVLMDHIASVPGIVFPLAELVKLCKAYGAISLVDAAHALGQIEVDVKAIDPDYWISNCHKWLYTPRGCAVLYVPMRNQQTIKSSFPTGPGYESRRYPTEGMDRPWVFAEQYDWTGTIDYSPYLTIPDCFAFRKEIGGEERIRRYCHDLALQGGRKVAERWGTRIMGGEGDELTAAMVNVEMPTVPTPKDLKEQIQQLTYFEDILLGRDMFCMTYRFVGRWWVRFSGQVWCELEDFDKVASVLEEAIEGITLGKHRKEDVDVERETREQENATAV